jgi:capsid protein
MIDVNVDYPARDVQGRDLVLHAFDPQDAEDTRGISLMAPMMRKYLMAESLDDSMALLGILQTMYAIALTSERPSAEAFEALEALKDTGADNAKDIADAFAGYFYAQLKASADGHISVGSEPQVSHLGPGEELSIKTPGVPGPDYLPFRKNLMRDAARTFGITYGGYTMDNSDATYSSVKMDGAILRPGIDRRRERIAAPHYQLPYEHGLEEEVFTGRIAFKGGYEAFRANRNRILLCNWIGPAMPTADDKKSAEASSERLLNGTSSIAQECSLTGVDPEENREARYAEHKWYVDKGMVSPYDRNKPSDPAAKQTAKAAA